MKHDADVVGLQGARRHSWEGVSDTELIQGQEQPQLSHALVISNTWIAELKKNGYQILNWPQRGYSSVFQWVFVLGVRLFIVSPLWANRT